MRIHWLLNSANFLLSSKGILFIFCYTTHHAACYNLEKIEEKEFEKMDKKAMYNLTYGLFIRVLNTSKSFKF